MNEEKKSLYKQTVEDCSILYCAANRPMTETCMCWGWECGKGWHSILRDLSLNLEALNVLNYPSYRVRIQADQVKEKFGTLRFYYTVYIDSGKFKTLLSKALKKIANRIKKLDFGIKRVVDAPASQRIERKEISKEEFDKYSKDVPCYGSYIESDGKFYHETTIYSCERAHYVPTKHKFMYWLSGKLMAKAHMLSYEPNPSKVQKLMAHSVETCVNAFVAKAEKDCYNVCEDCGSLLDDNYNPRCETKGWIRYVCENCAKKYGNSNSYIKHSSKDDGIDGSPTEQETTKDEVADEK